MVRRRFWHQLGPNKAQKGTKRLSHRRLKLSTKRSNNDIKFNINFNAIPRDLCQEVTLVVWAGMAPWGGAPGAQGPPYPRLKNACARSKTTKTNFQLPASNFQLPTFNFQPPTSNFQLQMMGSREEGGWEAGKKTRSREENGK